MNPPIIFDVDGVLAGFVHKILDFVNKRDDTNLSLDDISGDIRLYDFWDEELESYARSPGFCRNLEMLPQGCMAVETLLSQGENVLFVTSPYGEASTWCYDRTKWLESTFGVTRNEVIFARSKQYVHGITFFDDLPRNIFMWEGYWKRQAYLLNQPQNYETPYKEYDFQRVESTEEILEAVKKAKHEYAHS